MRTTRTLSHICNICVYVHDHHGTRTSDRSHKPAPVIFKVCARVAFYTHKLRVPTCWLFFSKWKSQSGYSSTVCMYFVVYVHKWWWKKGHAFEMISINLNTSAAWCYGKRRCFVYCGVAYERIELRCDLHALYTNEYILWRGECFFRYWWVTLFYGEIYSDRVHIWCMLCIQNERLCDSHKWSIQCLVSIHIHLFMIYHLTILHILLTVEFHVLIYENMLFQIMFRYVTWMIFGIFNKSAWENMRSLYLCINNNNLNETDIFRFCALCLQRKILFYTE